MAERRHQNLPTPIEALHDAAALARLHALAFDDGARSARLCRYAGTNRHGFGPCRRFYHVAAYARWGGDSTLAVHPEKRRRGLARRLMAHMITTLQPANMARGRGR